MRGSFHLTKITWAIIFLIVLSLACGLSTNVQNAKDTALAAATSIKEGSQFLSTAQSYATEVGESGLVETAKAMVTEAGSNGAVQTMQALVTQQAPGLLETGQAMLTEIPGSVKQPPADIPVLPGDKENFFVNDEIVSYLTVTSFADAVNFYKTEMPKNSWESVEKGSIETENAAVLNFIKGDQNVSITISVSPINNKTIVIIYIQKT